MTETTALLEKREEIKQKLTDGAYETLVDVILNRTGRFIQTLTRCPQPPRFWYSALVIALLTLVAAYSTSLFLGDTFETRPYAFQPIDILLGISTVGLGTAFVITTKVNTEIISKTLCDNLLDAIETVEDLTDLQGWLETGRQFRNHLLFSLTFGILVGSYGTLVISVTKGGFVGVGSTIIAVTAIFQYGLGLYFLFRLLGLPMRLSRYHFKLYAANPSSSEIIDHLSNMLSNFVYIGAVLAMIFTFVVALSELFILTIIILLALAGWVPLTTFFFVNQYSLAKIIARGKWKTLGEIQAQVERLRTRQDIPDKGTLEHLDRLMDYHDRIKATPDSALNLRAAINFLNSLLLPLLTLLLANIDKVIRLFF